MSSRSVRRTLILIALVVLLAVASLAVTSCAKNQTSTSSQTQVSSSQTSAQPVINSYLGELDQQINSITDSDFNENQLSDRALGL